MSVLKTMENQHGKIFPPPRSFSSSTVEALGVKQFNTTILVSSLSDHNRGLRCVISQNYQRVADARV